MAQQTITRLIDDLDGGEAKETVSFSLDGVAYEIDVNERNATRLRNSFAPFVGSARKMSGRGGGRTRGRGGARAGRSGNTAEIRSWAKQNGHQVNERGRIPATVMEAYEKANAS